MQRRVRLRTKQRNSREGIREGIVRRRMRWYGISFPSSSISFSSSEDTKAFSGVESMQPSNACSRSCVTKSELLSSRYTSPGLLHSILFVAEIQVASLGADQLSFGYTDPPSKVIVEAMAEWMSGHSEEGSWSDEVDEEVEEVEENIPLSEGEGE